MERPHWEYEGKGVCHATFLGFELSVVGGVYQVHRNGVMLQTGAVQYPSIATQAAEQWAADHVAQYRQWIEGLLWEKDLADGWVAAGEGYTLRVSPVGPPPYGYCTHYTWEARIDNAVGSGSETSREKAIVGAAWALRVFTGHTRSTLPAAPGAPPTPPAAVQSPTPTFEATENKLRAALAARTDELSQKCAAYAKLEAELGKLRDELRDAKAVAFDAKRGRR